MTDLPKGNSNFDLTRPLSLEGLAPISKIGGVPHRPRWSLVPLLVALFIALIVGENKPVVASLGSRPISEDKTAGVPAATRQGDRDDVPMFGGNPGRTGEMPGDGPNEAPDLKWEHPFDVGLWSTPAIVDGVAYLGAGTWDNGPQPGSLEAVDVETGASIWSLPLPTYSESSPAVDNGMVFVADDDGSVYGVTAADGKLVWTTKTDGVHVGAPIVAGGIVYVASGDAYDLNPALAGQTVVLAAGLINDDGVEYISNAILYALDATTGAEIWRASDFPDDEGALVAFDARTGAERWRTTVDWISLNATTDGTTVYVGTGNPGVVRAVDLQSGQEIWRYDTGKVFYAGTTPSVSGGRVFVTSDHSSVFAIDAATGHQMWTVDLQFMWMQSQPLIAGDHLYVGDQSGLIYALDIANGNPDWDYKLRPTTDFHGQLVVAGEVLYAAQTTGAEDDPYARVGYLSALFNPG